MAGRRPVLLSSTAERGYAATIELTNLESRAPDGRMLPQASLHLRRTRFIADGLREQVRVRNFHSAEVELVLDVHFDADFADLFEVRGLRRRRRGTRLPVRDGGRSLALSYLGLDDVVRETLVTFDEPPESLKQGRARFRLRLAPGAVRHRRLRRARARRAGLGGPAPEVPARRPPRPAEPRRRAPGPPRGAAPRARALGLRRHRHLHRQRSR